MMAIQSGENTTFYPDIRKIEVEDPGHADTFNPLFKILLDNTAYLKEEKADKTTVDDRIKELIGAAPAALDTLQELAEALNNDPSFASTMTNELAKKVDSAVGKQLSTEDYTTAEKTKLAGIQTGANKYTHPTTHPATMITEDAEHRFVTDAEKQSWDGKASTAAATTTADGLMSSADKTKLNGISAGANNYSHPLNHPASMITESTTKRFVTDAQIEAWDAKQGAVGYSPSRCETGTYTGDNTANRAVSLGFKPKCVKVIGNENTFELYPSLSHITPEARMMDGKNYTLNDTANIGIITATGFTLGSAAGNKSNKTGQTYTYIAMG